MAQPSSKHVTPTWDLGIINWLCGVLPLCTKEDQEVTFSHYEISVMAQGSLSSPSGYKTLTVMEFLWTYLSLGY